MNIQNTTSSNRVRKLLHYWFVQYNPLYFFSALCVLLGMFLVTRELPPLNWRQGQLFISGVMQAYELILIAGAALLFRGASQTVARYLSSARQSDGSSGLYRL